MWNHNRPTVLLAVSTLLLAAAGGAFASALEVVTTTTDLGSLARSVGGEDVRVTTFARGGDDPHFIEARPSFIRALHGADLLIYNGLDLEIGWLPALMRKARNSRILPGAPGHLDASSAIEPLEVLSGPIDRSKGDVHPGGNPHYLLDPLDGLAVARRLSETMAELRPERADAFRARFEAFREDLVGQLVGEELLASITAAEVEAAERAGQLAALRADRAPTTPVGGWLGELEPFAGVRVVADHNMWPYFNRRFRIRPAAFLEPIPGITPTTRHLTRIAEQMKEEKIRVILSAAYFHPRYADKLAELSGAKVLLMANQVGARPEATEYLDMVSWNVEQIADALR